MFGRRAYRYSFFSILVLTLTGIPVFAQEQPKDLNGYYRSPFAASAEYYSWTPFGEFSKEYQILEAATTLRFPLRAAPSFQPLVRAAFLRFDSLDTEFPEKWDHFYATFGLGFSYSSRFSKNFEIGAEALGAVGYSYYDKLVDVPVGYPIALGSAGLRLSLIPSFNLSVDVLPQARYLHSLGDVDRFNGLSLAVGFAATYRFGQDPDAPQSQIRSIRFADAEVPALFAALQSYYVNNPFGKITVKNVDTRAIEDVDVLFYQAGYMDSPTPSARVERMAPGESKTVEIRASFNEKVFDLEGVTPLTGEIVVRYNRDGRPAEQRQTVTYDLHDKGSLTWTDDRKMGSFVTPADSGIRNYASYVRQQAKAEILQGVAEPFQTAILLYHALGEIGIVYQIDPTSPFTQVKGKNSVVDSVSLPRDTLKRLTGDCDDLTALYSTMLETVGIETAFITVPGHIYMAFNTGVSARNFAQLHPDRSRLIIIGDSVWLPVEITMIGVNAFTEAWRYGAEEWNKAPADARGLYKTREAQAIYRPVGLRQTDLGLQYGDMGRVAQSFRRDIATIGESVLAEAKKAVKDRLGKQDYNRLGVLAAQWGRYDLARDAFTTAASMDASYLSPRINLGSTAFLSKQYAEAKRAFEAAREIVKKLASAKPETKAALFLNLGKTYFELKDFPAAQSSYKAAEEIDPANARKFSYIAGGGNSEGVARASEAVSGPAILFAEGE
ncbi:MAG: tetratricopeptide repeat protein [Treponemataceae bacterium]